MPNKSFYRTKVAFYASIGYRDPNTNRWVEGYTAPLFKKVNIQPFKDGEMLTFNESALYYTEGYKKVYFRPPLDFPENPSEDAQILFFFDGDFYQVKGNMDFTTLARGGKHVKMLAVKYSSSNVPDIEEPTL
tara:strand:+ start:24380 stop:24775 length:396 start_codon:yes stop_codon:yes gene_type:complete